MKEIYNELYAPPCPYTEAGIPRFDKPAYNEELCNWLEDCIKKGTAFISSNRGYKPGLLTKGILYGDNNSIKVKADQADIVINKTRRILREVIATQANIRPDWGYGTKRTDLESTTQILTKCLGWWWNTTNAFPQFRNVIQNAACSTGYMFLYPRRNYITGEIELASRALSFQDVLPIGIPSDMDLQRANTIMAKVEMPLSEAHEMFPNDVDRIKADRSTATWIGIGMKKAKSVFTGVVDMIRAKEKEGKGSSPFPTVDVFFTWTRDTAFNKTGRDLTLLEDGKPRVIPSYIDGDGNRATVKTGGFLVKSQLDLATGNVIETKTPETRLIEIEECYYYTNHRYIIYASGKVLVDKNFDQETNGLIPIFDFRYDRVDREFLGLPVIYDALSIGRNTNRLVRALLDMVVSKLYTPLAIDKSVPESIRDRINPRAARQSIFWYPINAIGKAVAAIIPADYYTIDPKALEIWDKFEAEMDYVTGTQDMAAIAKARQTPAADTQEKWLELSGSLATEQSRGMEQSISRFGTAWVGMFLQYTPLKRFINIVGYDGVTSEFIDYDPATIIPKLNENDKRTRRERLKDLLKSLTFYVVPNSLHEKNSMTNKLTVLQMKAKGVLVSDRKVWKVFNPEDTGYDAMVEEFYAEQKKKAEMATEIAVAAERIKAATNNNITLEGLMQHFSTENAGRPSDNTSPPKTEMKTDPDGVPRVTTATTSSS